MAPIMFTEVTVRGLWSIIGGSSNVNIEWLKEQMIPELDAGKPYIHVHRDEFYLIPLAEIQKFFEEHPRPAKKKTAAEEAAEWKRKFEESKKELEALKGVSPLPKEPAPMRYDGDNLVKAREESAGPAKVVDPNLALADEVTDLQQDKAAEPDTI